jgi:3-hydroxyisobutyrate dehydrogenase
MTTSGVSEMSAPSEYPESRRLGVGVLGTGTMGSAMARNLIRAGLRTTVWDRNSSTVAAMAASGAVPARSAAEAARVSDVVITMLPTSGAVFEVAEAGGLLDALAPGAVWVQMGTIGVDQTEQLASAVRSRRPDVFFVDAPVSGSKAPAEAGELLILASGPSEVADLLSPVFAAVGHRTIWLSRAGQGSRLKLVLNTWLAFLIEGIAESAALAEEMDVSLDELAGALEGGPLAAGVAMAKLHKIQTGDFQPEFQLNWALKDVKLALGGTRNEDLPVTAAIDRKWQDAVDRGFGELDLSAVWLAMGRSVAGRQPHSGRNA